VGALVLFGRVMTFSQHARFIACACAFTLCTPAQAEPDLGKRACAQEARTLCPAEMRSFSRKRVEACMIVKIDRTSPVCNAAMLRIKAERESAARR
jgi:hypothetical protein